MVRNSFFRHGRNSRRIFRDKQIYLRQYAAVTVRICIFVFAKSFFADESTLRCFLRRSAVADVFAKFPRAFKSSNHRLKDTIIININKSVARLSQKFRLYFRWIVKDILWSLVYNLQNNRPLTFSRRSPIATDEIFLAVGKKVCIFRTRIARKNSNGQWSRVDSLDFGGYRTFKPPNHRCSKFSFHVSGFASHGFDRLFCLEKFFWNFAAFGPIYAQFFAWPLGK